MENGNGGNAFKFVGKGTFWVVEFGFSILFLVLAIKEIRETKRTRELKEMLEKKQQEKKPEN